MQIHNISSNERNIYIVAIILSVVTYFLTPGFDEKTNTLVAVSSFFVFSFIGLYIYRTKKLIFEVHNGVLDKDIKLYLYSNNKKIDSYKIRAEHDLKRNEVKATIEDFLRKNAQFIKQYSSINVTGFSHQKEQVFLQKIINEL